ncbi:MAG: uracil-DNA glycosylase [Chloroflexota bacterium]
MLEAYLEALASRPGSPAVANPYRGPAGEARLRNLRHYLTTVAEHGPAVALIGEAPGYRGCAVTGIPFTSRQVLATDTGRWGLFVDRPYLADAGLGEPWAEATATIMWRHILQLLPSPPLLGNAFPFHPHPASHAASNRPLTADELAEGAGYLRHLLSLFPSVRVIAVGRQAAHALGRIGVPPTAALRHPSHGGATTFAAGLRCATRDAA